MKKNMKKVKEKLIRIFLVLQFTFLFPETAFAGGLENTKLVKGTNKLIEDGIKVLVAMEVGLVTFLLIKEGMNYQKAPDEEKGKHKKNLTGIAVAGVVVISLTSLVPAILGYYQ